VAFATLLDACRGTVRGWADGRMGAGALSIAAERDGLDARGHQNAQDIQKRTESTCVI